MTTIPRILTIQDMSSIGRCSLTVMLPIISALQCQAVPLATAVLSNHLEYPYFEIVDLSDHLTALWIVGKKITSILTLLSVVF